MMVSLNSAVRERTLVIGATGMLGGEILRLICDSGKSVRATFRDSTDSAKRDMIRQYPAEIISADLKDPASLAAACQGVTSVISTATAITSRIAGDSINAIDELGQLALVEAAERVGVKHFVFLSFLPNIIDYAFQRAKRMVETQLQKSRMTFTILQPTAFMEIWLSPMLGFDPAGGHARILGDGKQPVSWVSIHDVARFAVAASEGCQFSNLVIPLGGPDPLTSLQVVQIFQELGAPNVVLDHVPLTAIEAMLANAQNPVDEALAAGMLTTARGQVVDLPPTQQLLPGRLISIRDYASRILNVKCR